MEELHLEKKEGEVYFVVVVIMVFLWTTCKLKINSDEGLRLDQN